MGGLTRKDHLGLTVLLFVVIVIMVFALVKIIMIGVQDSPTSKAIKNSLDFQKNKDASQDSLASAENTEEKNTDKPEVPEEKDDDSEKDDKNRITTLVTKGSLSTSSGGGSSGSSGGSVGGDEPSPDPGNDPGEDPNPAETTLTRTLTNLGGSTYKVDLSMFLVSGDDVLVVDETLPSDSTITDNGGGNQQTQNHLKWVFLEKSEITDISYTVEMPASTAITGVYATNTISQKNIS